MRKLTLLILGITLLGLLTACGGGAAPTPTEALTTAPTQAPATEAPTAMATEAPTAAPTGGLRTPEEAALAAAGGQKIGGTVSVLAVWGGSEQESFMAMLKPFEDATGVKVEYTGTRDLNAVLTTRIQGGNPPDLAGLPGPGQMAQYARAGNLVDLSTVLDMNTYKKDYAQTWIDLGSVDGKLVGIFMRASVKGLIWYDPKVWTENNYQFPQTWDDMMTLSKQIKDAGNTPWCVALESGSASGWPGTDWLEDIVLRQSGEQVYNQWWQGQIAWTSPEIKQAWQTWGEIVATSGMVYGGPNTMLSTNFGGVGNPLFTTPPGCYMVHQASFISSFFEQNNPGVKPITDFDWFGFPPFKPNQPVSTEMAGDLFGMFNDTPQARALINYLTTPEAQDIWVKLGADISPNKVVPLGDYPDELSRKAAERLTSAQIAVFDASDMMPEAMNAAFWKAILDYVQAPDTLDSILQNLDTVQKEAYQGIPTPTEAPTAMATEAPTAMATKAPTAAPAAQAAPAAAVPDFAKLGFPTVLASQDITPGQAATITSGPFSVEVPGDAFDVPVKFELLTGDLATFLANAPTGEMPVLDFAFRVTDMQNNQLIGKFNNPVTFTAKSNDITDKSMYYNIAPDGTYTANATGMQVAAGELTHPIAGAVVGWVITSPAPAPAGGKVALLLPETKTTRYEAHDRPDFESKFMELCPNCNIIYSNANQDANAQLSQAEAALTNGAQVMVLDPVDSAAAAVMADKSKAQGVPVIAYDRLILNSDGVNYYISFDNVRVGQLQAQALVNRLNELGIQNPVIVMINGSPTDNNAKLFKQGAHSVFDPLVQAGKLTIAKEYDTPDWSPNQAQNEMQQALTALGNKVDGVYCANDGTASGAIAAMIAAGIKPLPPVTGQDAELAAIQRILTGDQYMTVYKAIKPEADAAAQLAYDLLTNTPVPAEMAQDKTTNNGKIDVPSVLLTPIVVTKDNIKDTVVKDGFWTVQQICTPEYADACKAAGLE
jgi:D-xylose ABC transporter substrate-binding protein